MKSNKLLFINSLLPMLSIVSLFLMFLYPMQITDSPYNTNYGPVIGYNFLAPNDALNHWWGSNMVLLTEILVWLAFLFAFGLLVFYITAFFLSYSKNKFLSFGSGLFVVVSCMVWPMIYSVGGFITIQHCASSYHPRTLSFLSLIMPIIIFILYIILYKKGSSLESQEN